MHISTFRAFSYILFIIIVITTFFGTKDRTKERTILMQTKTLSPSEVQTKKPRIHTAPNICAVIASAAAGFLITNVKIGGTLSPFLTSLISALTPLYGTAALFGGILLGTCHGVGVEVHRRAFGGSPHCHLLQDFQQAEGQQNKSHCCRTYLLHMRQCGKRRQR